MEIFKREPALIIGAVQAAIVLGVAFGLNLTTGQTGAILTCVTAVLALVTRQSVVAPANVNGAKH